MAALHEPRAEPAAPAASLLSPRFVRLTMANFCFFLTFASFFLLPLHVRALGGSERTIGLVMGTAGVSGLASLLVIGTLLDRLGRRAVLLGGIVAMGVTSFGYLFVTRVGPALFVLRTLQGLAFAAGFNAASTLAAEFAPIGRRAAALGLFGVSTLATHALAPAIGELIVSVGGFRLLFVVAAGYTVVSLAVAWSLPGPPLAHTEARARPLRETPGLTTAMGAVACCGMAFGSVLTYVPTFTRDEALGPVSAFFLSYTTTAVLTRVVAGGLSDSLGRRQVIVPSLALLAVSITVLAEARSLAVLVGAGLLFGTAQGFVYPTLNAFTVDLSEPRQLARVQTFYNGAFNLGVTMGSVALGFVAHAWGHRVMFLCSAAAAVMALGVFGAGVPRGRRRARSSVRDRE